MSEKGQIKGKSRSPLPPCQGLAVETRANSPHVNGDSQNEARDTTQRESEGRGVIWNAEAPSNIFVTIADITKSGWWQCLGTASSVCGYLRVVLLK